MLTDTHCHLDFHKFDPDRAAVLERAAWAGVERILIPGLTLTSSLAAVKLAESHPMLFAAIGVHPTEASGIAGQPSDVRPSTFDPFRELAQHPKVKAIGEIGLDYYWDAAPHDLQRRALREQLALAAEVNLPVVIHMREKGDAPDGPCAWDLMKILEDWVAGLRSRKEALAEAPGVLHSFSGSLETARQAIRLGFYIGVTGPVTYRRERQELIAALPMDRLLIETDAPFLAPAPQRGKRNEPAYVRLIADKIALLHGTSIEHIAKVTSANAKHLFGWKD
ncbi:MAG: TatD family hydrolase [Candidatus Villigracilaceae bacterium]